MRRSNPKVKTPTGTYIGNWNGNIEEYLGIRYCDFQGPWKPARELPENNDAQFNVREFSPACIQPFDPCVYASQGKMSSRECLTLNLWTKSTENIKKPVMVYFYGGGFTTGGNNDPALHGKNFVRRIPEGEDVVLITVNYRLGIFGSMELSFLDGYTEEYDDCNSLWVLDQIEALKWVNKNVRAFGGDPDNVTIFGQSAGSMSVSWLAANPRANKYFHKGIMQSGIPFFAITTVENKISVAQNICKDLGIHSIDDLISKDDAYWLKNYPGEYKKYAPLMSPRAGDKNLPSDFWNQFVGGNAKDIKLMIGCCTGELDMYVYKSKQFPERKSIEDILKISDDHYRLFGEADGLLSSIPYRKQIMEYVSRGENLDEKQKRAIDVYNLFSGQLGVYYYADAQSKWNKDTYVYLYDYVPEGKELSTENAISEPSPWNRPPHCAELAVLFDNPEVAYSEYSQWWVGYGGGKPIDRYDRSKLPEGLTEKMIMTWYSFAKNGTPDNDLIPKWEPYEKEHKNTMIINSDWNIVSDPLREAMDVFSEARPIGE